jgi:GT2 family glycosyltransferase
VKLSTVIVSYNTREELAAALESLLATQGDLAHEIIVVDNHGHDGVAELVRERFPSVILIAPEKNSWFTGGNNIGMRAAQGDYVFMLNPDTVMQSQVLQKMVAFLDTHPNVGLLTSRMVYPNGEVQRTGSRRMQYFDLLLDYTPLGLLAVSWRAARRRQAWYDGWARDSTRAVEVAPGSNMMVRRTVLDQVGLYDEALKLYFPEDDFCQRIRAAGHEVVFIADTTIIHHEHASTDKSKRMATRIYYDDLLTYTRKHFGALAALLLLLGSAPLRAAMWIKQTVSKT